MSVVFLTNSNNDRYLDSAGHFAKTNKNIEVAAQLAKNYLWTFLGEFFADKSIGTDYFGIIFNEFASMDDRLSELTRVLLTVPFIEEVESIAYSQDKQTGVTTFAPTIIATSGERITLNSIGIGG
jgi:hypothetical protein